MDVMCRKRLTIFKERAHALVPAFFNVACMHASMRVCAYLCVSMPVPLPMPMPVSVPVFQYETLCTLCCDYQPKAG